MNSYTDKKVLVVGLGSSGRAAISLLLSQKAKVFAYDDRIISLEQKLQFEDPFFKGLNWHNIESSILPYDMIVMSPGISKVHPIYKQALKIHKEVIGEVELAAQMIVNPCIGITGTNGKTTVTSLVAHILNQSNRKALAVGNIGVPLCDLVQEPSDTIFIIELSSYQLETLKTPFLDHAMILNITLDHLDRYPSFEAYVEAKCNIYKGLKSKGSLYLDEDFFDGYAHSIPYPYLKRFGYQKDLIQLDILNCNKEKVEYILPVSYRNKNMIEKDNILSAFVICFELGLTEEECVQGLKSFKRPAHRLEWVRELNGVHYYNDSKGTNIASVSKAVQAFDNPTILIAGGVDKGLDFLPWGSYFRDKVKYLCVIGEAGDRIKNELSPYVKGKKFDTLASALHFAKETAITGDVILLSPGCSSFDMFKNYEHRGEVFKRLVESL